MEFREENKRSNRKILSLKGWIIEYSLNFTPSSNPAFENEAKNRGSRKTVFAFHGFARPLEDFAPLIESWPQDCAFISVHLLHHGASRPDPETHPLDAAIEPQQLLLILTEIAKQEEVKSDRFDLIGYSIGGRIALSLVEYKPLLWNRIVLLAPDGLKKSPFYGITVHTRLGKILWFAIDQHCDIVLKWSDRLLRLKLISAHLHGFIAFHLSSHAMRMMVWNGWRSHRKCWPSHKQIASAFESTNGPIDLFFGNRDRIIPVKNGARLQELTQEMSHVHFHEVSLGHGMLRKETLPLLIQRIFPE